ncbi:MULTISPECIES: adenosylcobinamide-GDP ribazoletransferase [unclassified Vibrio]|uniref:adenosylcobinamide-GDP ribazoletransferase n=1 Tax=unclassified Vibrio TaxID=2614977 RepID=UPI000C828D50|nr:MULTISPECIES: adenosylcobinamide-GDP ribazoletransferase [unclassified Vibrio]PMI96093.1 adenosylcobinamide-GDP ribazoletransferase [Vibrio sp. 10N.286.45.E10]PTP00012.1 adenosylcobinamide-GDP ribazoletransferase [Vibrio sp. 10N.286.45.A3]PTQ22905.1 adenosylcobinamide-GDP ribazoletransferase [Vibrio sp. 10N.286.46.E10]TKE85018.1 adenosylcobinamide-GDP ribazoletransferase [Vibrio sp. F12]TKE92442.1 adenosylcobinamide-GDP ribazoletransferase [Vibrio sp. F12]
MSDTPEGSLKDRVTYQWELFALAMGFFSRLPMPKNTPYSTERMNRSGRYFSTVGLLLGVLCGCVFLLLDAVLPSAVAIFLMMSFSLMLTGAFHEDGLTDMADGIGGGMTLERRLTIMKDSRIGTYGASALVMVLLGKWVLLNELVSLTGVFMVIVTSYTFSRAIAASLIYDMPYVSDLDTSKSKPLANKQTKGELVFLLFVGVLPSLWFGLEFAMVLSVVAYLFRAGFKKWLTARIGGFTGDCLGAAQQLMELLIYLVFITVFYNGFL